MQTLAVQFGKDARHHPMQLAHRQLMQPRVRAVRLHPGNRGEKVYVSNAISALVAGDG